MDLVTLQKGNELQTKIGEFNAALNCFEWVPCEVGEYNSRNPRLAIEFDHEEGGRGLIKLPMNLNEMIIAFIKDAIRTNRDALVEEFNGLRCVDPGENI